MYSAPTLSSSESSLLWRKRTTPAPPPPFKAFSLPFSSNLRFIHRTKISHISRSTETSSLNSIRRGRSSLKTSPANGTVSGVILQVKVNRLSCQTTRYSIDERSVKSSPLAFSYSVTGSYVAVWPLAENVIELEHCLFNPNDKESRVRIFQLLRLEETKMLLQSVKVFCELWYGPFRDGDQLGGCAMRSSGFASTPTTPASVVAGSWRALLATTTTSNAQACVQQVTGEKVIDIVREEKDLLLLPKDLWCELQQGKDGERAFSIGWLFEPGHAVTSSCVFSSASKLKEVTMARETAQSHV
ncbi:unnamed protein product [Microthlaspi erraticum]|uniref:DUF3598 domain-containing protein n=1 Tax=Microthlaspi erraticum TaxID=1685480 RepID=A0A6D2HJN8_9BRAS|nr:unnamed protein product [Microthlaspi erraticum]